MYFYFAINTSFNRSRELKFNKDYEQWLVEKDEITQGEDSNTGVQLSPTPPGGQLSPSQGEDYTPPQGVKSTPKKESIKYNFKDIPNTNNARATAFEFYERNISLMPTEPQRGQLETWIMDLGDDFVYKAIEVACLESEGPPTFKFLKYLIDDWIQHGAKTVDDIERLQKEFRKRRKQRGDPRKQKHKGIRQVKVPEYIDKPPDESKPLQDKSKKQRIDSLLKDLGEYEESG